MTRKDVFARWTCQIVVAGRVPALTPITEIRGLSSIHTDGNETVVYELENGKVKTMTIDWPAEYLTVRDELIYEGDKLVEMNLYAGGEGADEHNYITWNGDNIAEYYHISGEGTNKEAWKKLDFHT